MTSILYILKIYNDLRLLSKDLFLKYLLYGCLYVNVYVHGHVASALRDQERVSECLGLELTDSCEPLSVVLGTGNTRVTSMLNHRIFLSNPSIFILR